MDGGEAAKSSQRAQPLAGEPHSVRKLCIGRGGAVLVGTNRAMIFIAHGNWDQDSGRGAGGGGGGFNSFGGGGEGRGVETDLMMTGHYGDTQALGTHHFSPVGEFVTGGEDGQLILWSAVSRSLVRSTYLGKKPRSCDFHPDGDVIVAGCADGSFVVLQVGGQGGGAGAGVGVCE